MKDEFVIINKTQLLKRIEELENDIQYYKANVHYAAMHETAKVKLELENIISQSTPLIPDIKDIQIWLSKQPYQKEYGEQEYMMYYDVDVPKIIQDYISNLKLDI